VWALLSVRIGDELAALVRRAAHQGVHGLLPAQVYKWHRLAELGVIGVPGASELPSLVDRRDHQACPVIAVASSGLPRTSIRTPSMSISTDASAKSLPARIGVTKSTVIETMLDPASFDCTPSIENAAIAVGLNRCGG
jgi:hypothetical protein